MEKFSIKNRRYLGSKARLIPFIEEVVKDNCKDIYSFADIFGGTGIVGYAFNDGNHKIIENDILECNRLSYLSFFGNENIDEEKIKSLLFDFNSCNPKTENYFSKNFSDTYFSRKNCLKIGYIRQRIENLYKKHEVNERERAILITSLLYAMDHIANTVGHYDAFRLNGNLDKELVLEELSLPKDGINSNNEIYKEDANILVKRIKADMVYIDPPYNSRQYCDAYHLLENVATWEKPAVYGVAKKMDRGNLKSEYCMHSAPKEFEDLISNIDAKYILVSYNNMGTKGAGRSQAKISDTDIMNALSKRGKVKVFEKKISPFTTGKSDVKDHKERLFLCKIGDKGWDIESEEDVKGFVKSPLNYTGGKFKLLSQLEDHFPKSIETFIDLFGGGFNVGANVNSSKIVYNDNQKQTMRIVELFKKFHFKQIIERIDSIISEFGLSNSYQKGYEFYGCNCSQGLGNFNKSKYEKLRGKYNKEKKNCIEADFDLLTLIIFSFNNQIRFNSKCEFNMPVGKRDFNSQSRKHIEYFSRRLFNRDIEFTSQDFRKLDISKYDSPFVYCDPPYFLGKASYNENGGWSEQDEKDLLTLLSKLNNEGIKFALSNMIKHKGQEHTILENWVKNNGFNLIKIKSNYSNSNYHIINNKLVTEEVLITNY